MCSNSEGTKVTSFKGLFCHQLGLSLCSSITQSAIRYKRMWRQGFKERVHGAIQTYVVPERASVRASSQSSEFNVKNYIGVQPQLDTGARTRNWTHSRIGSLDMGFIFGSLK